MLDTSTRRAAAEAGGPAHPLLAVEPRHRDRLLEVLEYAAAGLAKLDDYARVWSESSGRREDDGDAFLRRRDKVAAEALLLAYLASRAASHDDAALDQCVTRLAAAAEAQIATGRNEALLRRFPQTATTLGQGFVLLALLGRRRPAIEERLREALRSGRATFSERVPYRLMDSRWTYGLLDPALLGPPEELLRHSTLAASPHPLHTMSADDYALTHALFYLTDFGRRPAPALGDARVLLDPFLAWNSVRLDLDLLGEFLVASLALRAPASPASRFGWEILDLAWEEEGGLVGPEYAPRRFAELQGLEAEAYAFSENYHTAFVGGILCAVALTVPPSGAGAQPPSAPPELTALGARCALAATRAGASRVDGAALCLARAEDLAEWVAARLMQVEETAPEPTPLWLRTAAESALSRAETTGVLLDALLVAAGRRYRLVQLAQALVVAARRPELRSPTFARALEFLLDQQLDDGSVGIHGLLADAGSADAAPAAQATLALLLRQVATALAA